MKTRVQVEKWATAYLVLGLCVFDKGNFEPTTYEVDADGGVKAEEGIGREHEPLLLVRLERKNASPEVEGRQSQGHDSECGSFVSTGGLEAKTPFVNNVGYSKGGKREEGQGSQQIEV